MAVVVIAPGRLVTPVPKGNDSAWRMALEGNAPTVMPARDFSSQLLERCGGGGLGVIEMRGVRWSDWGRPERIAETLRGLGKRPAFPSELLKEPIEPYPGQVAAS